MPGGEGETGEYTAVNAVSPDTEAEPEQPDRQT